MRYRSLPRQIFSLLLLCLPTLIFAQNVLTLEANAPRTNDKMEREVISVNIKHLVAEQNIWDLGNIEILGRKKLQYISYGDSSILEISNGIVYTYQMKNNTCWLLEYETPQWNLKYFEPLKMLAYPFSLGDSCQIPFTAKGMYGKKYTVEKKGKILVIADAEGKLLLNANDTLPNVLRVHYAIESNFSMSNGTSLSDTLQTRQEEKDVYRWFAKEYRYPILEIVTSKVLCQGQVVTEFSCAYLLSPNEQSSLFDRENEEVRHRLQKEQVAAKKVQQEIISDLQAHANDGTLEVSFNLSSPCKFKFVISDISGVIYQQKTANCTNEHVNHEHMDCSSMRRGEYIVYVSANGKVYSSKFSIK